MATKHVELPDGESAVINNDPYQVHMDRLVELTLLARKDEGVIAKISAAAIVAYTEGWSLTDDEGAIPLTEDAVRSRVRSSMVSALYEAINAFTEETAPKPPNSPTPRPKKSRRGDSSN